MQESSDEISVLAGRSLIGVLIGPVRKNDGYCIGKLAE